MRAYRVETTLSEDGHVSLSDLPFNAGERVEIIVLAPATADVSNPYPLRDLPYRYDDPFEPAVTPDDWDALK